MKKLNKILASTFITFAFFSCTNEFVVQTENSETIVSQENGTSDKCKNYTVAQIFAPYKNFSTQSVNDWYKKFVKLYKSSDEQEQANIKATFKHNGVDL